jgi:hypothetical protein
MISGSNEIVFSYYQAQKKHYHRHTVTVTNHPNNSIKIYIIALDFRFHHSTNYYHNSLMIDIIFIPNIRIYA